MTADAIRPWYRYPMMWLVIAPPLAAVIAGIVTATLIVKHPEQDVRQAHAVVLKDHGSNSVVPPAE